MEKMKAVRIRHRRGLNLRVELARPHPRKECTPDRLIQTSHEVVMDLSKLALMVPALLLTVAVMSLGTAQAQSANPGAGVVRQLFRQPLADEPGMDAVVITVTYPPGGSTPAHEHPGFACAYVLKGAVMSALRNDAPKTYTEGQSWSERPFELHRISRNASKTAAAELLVFFVVPHKAKLVIPAPAKPN